MPERDFKKKLGKPVKWKTIVSISAFCVGALSFGLIATSLLLIFQGLPFSRELISQRFYVAPSVILTASILVIIACIIACIAAHRRSIPLMAGFIGITGGCVLLILLALILLIQDSHNPLAMFPKRRWFMLWDNDYLSLYELDYACCGYLGPRDYVEDLETNKESYFLHDSCCEESLNCTRDSSDLRTKTCREALVCTIKKYYFVFIILCVLMMIACALTIVFAVFLILTLQQVRKSGDVDEEFNELPEWRLRESLDRSSSSYSKNKKKSRSGRVRGRSMRGRSRKSHGKKR